MIRGTTPTHIFSLPIDTSTIRELRITYAQFDRTVLEKTESDVEMDEKTITLTLTQEETLKFKHSYKVELQLKVLTDTGTVLATPIKSIDVSEILNTEVLT